MVKTDDALVREARDGALPAFDELMLRYEKLVCKVAMNYVRDKQSGLDVTQNVFLKVWNHLDRVTAEGMFKPWLLRITYNESINWLRKRKRVDSHEEAIELDTTSLASVPEDQQERVEAEEERRQVATGLSRLNPKYRLALSLRYAEGLRVREIADVMGCSEGMVKSLLFRGVRQIRQHVARSA